MFQFYSETYLPQVNRAVADFVSRLIWGEPDNFGLCCTMAVGDDELIAGVVYHNYQPDDGTIEISCASTKRHWMTRDVIQAAFDMPFRDLGCQAIVARHSVDNKAPRHIWTAMGAKEYIIPRLRGKYNPDEAIAVLTDDAWAVSRFNREAVSCS